MAQRNPMNDRYQGDGPKGQTRKSAAKLKPKTEAASSVYIEKKPTTKQERKAAQKRRDAQLAAKEKERKRKAVERDRREREAAGEVIPEPRKETMGDKVKNIFFVPRAAPTDSVAGAARQTSEGTEKKASETSATGNSGNAPSTSALPKMQPGTWRKGPDTPQYRKLKYLYWSLLGVGLFFLLGSFLLQYLIPSSAELFGGWGTYIPLFIAYPAVISALILDTAKIRKIQREHAAGGQTGRQSPKQQKHTQQKREAAVLLEQSRQAQKKQKRENSKIPLVKTGTKGEESVDNKNKTKTEPDSDNPDEETSEKTEE